MKKKYTNILLGVAVLAIWFLIIKRIVSTLNNDDGQSFRSFTNTSRTVNDEASKDSLFFQSLRINNRSPFRLSQKTVLNKPVPQKPINEPIPKTNQIDSVALAIEQFKEVSKYYGLIENKQKNKTVGLLEHKGTMLQVLPKDRVGAEFKVLNTSEKAVSFQYKNKEFTIALIQ